MPDSFDPAILQAELAARRAGGLVLKRPTPGAPDASERALEQQLLRRSAELVRERDEAVAVSKFLVDVLNAILAKAPGDVLISLEEREVGREASHTLCPQDDGSVLAVKGVPDE